METIKEFKVSDPWDYKAPASQAQILSLPPRRFITLAGEGDPNGDEFAAAMTALYSSCYAVRMSYRAPSPPSGSGPYVVGVLQGHWGLRPGATEYDIKHKENLAWTIMIRQPDFLTTELFQQLVAQAKAKADKKGDIDLTWFDRLSLCERDGGSFAQIMHYGPYDEEPASFAKLEASAADMGWERQSKNHWEIYLGDPRKTAPGKLKTILRIAVAPKS